MGSSDTTRILMGVNESSIKGYPHPSISSRKAFEWTVDKIVRNNFAGFTILFVHVQVPDEDGFDDMDSVYASPEDFKSAKHRDKVRGLHLLEYLLVAAMNMGFPVKHGLKGVIPRTLSAVR
ncbi:universal stress protein A-like protein isoform X1 [Iris pallida]|uniref:Universal stress protein A-like protein isoform X1 n=1 Tax=Iris pallida TaxID=29817 RepID=A0AAX6DM68_IRIPA|nr:universal stress protein A-like protein isoform X1 [Iris pallida]